MKKRRFDSAARVTLADWLKLKPYRQPLPGNYDAYFLRRCNEVFSLLEAERELFDSFEIRRDSRRELACRVVSFYEDFASEIGLWKAFTDTNLEQFGYRLPFFNLSEYDPEFLNPEDFAFLIWHFMSRQAQHATFSPFDPFIWDLTTALYDLLDEAIEDCPATDFYENFLAIPDGSDFFLMKERLDWLTLHSWLMGLEMSKEYAVFIREVLEIGTKKGHPIEQLNILIYSQSDHYLFHRRASFSAISGPEWLARVARCSDACRTQIRLLDDSWTEGFFVLEGQNSHSYLFRHVGLDQVIEVVKISMKNNAMPPGTPCDGSLGFDFRILFWNGGWWFSGSMMGGEVTPDDIKRRRTEPQKRVPLHLHNPEKARIAQESTDDLGHDFNLLFGGPLAVFASESLANRAQNVFVEFYQAAQIARNGRKSAPSPVPFQAKIGWHGLDSALAEPGKSTDSWGLFFEKSVGLVMQPRIKRTIELLTATRPLNRDEQHELLLETIRHRNPVLTNWLLERYGWQNLAYPEIGNLRIDLRRELPFLLRMEQPDSFGKKVPMMMVV